MYKVKVDEKLLCFTGSVNGMEYVTDPDVKLVVNGVDSFSFAIYPQHPLYKEIACKVSRVKIWRDSKLLFYGEVTGYSQDMYGIRTYDCEGALAWLNDLHFAYSISGATPKDVLYWYIKMYNQKLRDKSKSFELGDVTVHKAMTQDGTEGTIARSSGVYPSFWEEIQDKLLNSFGGILRVRYVGSDTCAGYIDWLAIPSGTCSQDVRYAKNLLNCDWAYDCTSIATAVVPLGKRKDSSGDNEVRLTIDKADDDDATFMIQYMTGTDDLVKSGNMVYSKSRMEKYGLIQQAITFDDITDAGTLAYQGAVWLRQNGKASSTIRAEAIDLADIDESVEHFTHGDYVRTKLPGDSAESLFPITAIEIPIAAPENAKLTVGTQESGITSESGGQGGGSIADAGSGADAMAHTHSNKGVLDKITEQDYADFKGAVNKAHIHANKDTLDKIDETAWLTVYGQSHEHDNKGVLDRITAQDYADFKASANKAHVHDNKSTLDKIDETSWLLVYGQTHIHENQSVLDKTTASYTAAEKTKLAGIAAGAEVNQNAFSTIASGSARYTATSKTAAFVIEGEDGTSVTLSTNGRATISSHSHSNKAVLDATTASYTTAEQTKLKGVSAGAEVNQNAFSTIATGSARYVATAKQSAFLIDGDGGTSVSLDTKTGRLTVSSHTHDNKAVLDQLDEEQWKFINGAANKAHVHDNKGTLDKITDVGWNTVYGYAHSHDNKSVLDKTTASYTAADKKKLDGMDLSKYLPKSGGVMTGDIDMQANKRDILVGTHKATTSDGTAVAGGIIEKRANMTSTLPEMRSFVGMFHNTDIDRFYNLISVRHRNGYSDGNLYGMYIFSESTTASADLKWGKQTKASGWTNDFTLLDSRNYTNYALTKDGTAVKANALSAGHMKYGYVQNSTTTAGSGYTWARVAYCEDTVGYDTITMTLLATSGHNGAGLFSVSYRNGSTGKACDWIRFEQIFTNKPTGLANAYFKFVAVYTDSGVRYEIWHNTQVRWNSTQFTCLAEQAYAGANTNRWIFEKHDATTFQTAPPTGNKEATYYNNGVVNTATTLTDSGWVAMTVEGYAKSGTVKYRTYGKQITITGSVVLKNDIATSYPTPQYIASTTFDFSKIVGCSGVGRSSSGVGAYVVVENYNGDNLVCVYALGSKIAAGSTLYFTITGFID